MNATSSSRQPDLILTSGIPGSGKSTWAEQWVAEDPENRVRVNRDAIRMETFGTWFPVDADGRPDKAADQKVSEIEERRIREALKAGKDTVVDATHLTPKSWSRHQHLARQFGANLTRRDFPVDLEEALRRNAARERQVPDFVIRGMYKGLGPNGEFHHFDGTYTPRAFVAPEKPGQLAVGFDLDGTLCDTRPINHYVEDAPLLDKEGNPVLNSKGEPRRKPKNFDMFHRASFFCEPNPEVVAILRDAQAHEMAVIGTTAREEPYREVTEVWLNKHGLELDNLFMRKKGDMRPDYIVKAEMLRDEIRPHYDLVHQVDDNPQAVEAFVRGGVRVTTVPGWGAGERENNGSVIRVGNPFRSGGCLRCGRPLKNGVIGPKCATRG